MKEVVFQKLCDIYSCGGHSRIQYILKEKNKYAMNWDDPDNKLLTRILSPSRDSHIIHSIEDYNWAKNDA